MKSVVSIKNLPVLLVILLAAPNVLAGAWSIQGDRFCKYEGAIQMLYGNEGGLKLVYTDPNLPPECQAENGGPVSASSYYAIEITIADQESARYIHGVLMTAFASQAEVVLWARSASSGERFPVLNRVWISR